MFWLIGHTLEHNVEHKGGIFAPASVIVPLVTSCHSDGAATRIRLQICKNAHYNFLGYDVHEGYLYGRL